MMDNIAESRCTDSPLADIGVAVFTCASGIFTVIDVKQCNLILSYQLIKLVNYAVKVVDDIISGIVQMAGIHTNPQFFIVSDLVKKRGQFLKAAADFRALSSHCFQCDTTVFLPCQNLIQTLSNSVNTCFHTCAHVCTGMQDQDF